MSFKNGILEAVKLAQKDSIGAFQIYNAEKASDKKNNFVFFIKPELTKESNKIDFSQIIDIIFDKLSEFSVDINKISILDAKYLKENEVMANHYGVINQIAKNARLAMSVEAKDRFFEVFGKLEGKKIFGGLEFLERHNDLTPEALDKLWMQHKPVKLAGGTYCINFEYKGENIYLVNGFHASQLEHFVKKGRSIVVFDASSDSSWSALRNDLIGKTDPKSAKAGSLRRIFLEQSKAFGIEDVSQGSNGVHLSAGPVEGLVELIRFFLDKELSIQAQLEMYPFGNCLLEEFGLEKSKQLLANNCVIYDGIETTTFDMTEDCNSDVALKKLSSITLK